MKQIRNTFVLFMFVALLSNCAEVDVMKNGTAEQKYYVALNSYYLSQAAAAKYCSSDLAEANVVIKIKEINDRAYDICKSAQKAWESGDSTNLALICETIIQITEEINEQIKEKK